ncbi:hypothetical protein [Dactylosporangium sp. CA-139066]|uniref:hypothetical protein n=1 Tax=Dactylosporangium sp. CA-139066 TaxID=3239930 RepID=UPI003D94A22C
MAPHEGRRRPVPPRSAQTRVRRHRFDPDDAVPEDFWGRRICIVCQCAGAAGDARHFADNEAPPRYPEVADEVRELERRRFGERDDL